MRPPACCIPAVNSVFLRSTLPVIDGSLTGWISLLPRLAQLRAKVVAPGHGRGGGAVAAGDALDDERRYFTVLADDAAAADRGGRASAMRAVPPEIGGSER